MRVIDADELIEYFTGDAGDMPLADIKINLDDVYAGIAQAETVDSIPISWINEYLEKKYPHESTKMIEDMVSDWEYRDDL